MGHPVHIHNMYDFQFEAVASDALAPKKPATRRQEIIDLNLTPTSCFFTCGMIAREYVPLPPIETRRVGAFSLATNPPAHSQQYGL